MRSSFDSRDDGHADIGYVFKNLTALVVSLAPNTGVGDIAESGEINSRNEIAACAGYDDDLVRSILRDPVEGVEKLCMVLSSEGERPAVAVKFSNQHTCVVSCQLQAAVLGKISWLRSLHIEFSKSDLGTSIQHTPDSNLFLQDRVVGSQRCRTDINGKPFAPDR